MLSRPLAHTPRGWLRFGGAILIMSLLAGCAAAGSSGSPIASPSRSVSASPAGPTPSAVSAPAATRLASALKPLLKASAFETIVKVGGAVAVSAKGRTVGDTSRVTVTTVGRTVEYIEIPPKAWARDGSAAWVLLAVEQAPVAPLDVLGVPLSLQAPTGAGPDTFTATYPAKALGLDGDPLTVTITIVGDSVTFRYAATTAGQQSESTTTIRPAAADPISAPK